MALADERAAAGSEPGTITTVRGSLARIRWVLLAAMLGLATVHFGDGNAAFLAGSVVAIFLVAAATVDAGEALPPIHATPDGLLKMDPASLADALADPSMVLRRSGRVASLNAAARETFPRAKIDVPISFVIRAPDVLEALDAVRTGGGLRTVRLRNPGFREKAFDVSVSLVPQHDAEPVLLLQLKDISHAERIEKMRTDFVANASHELRTPLASVLGFIETLQGPAKDDAPGRERFLGIMAQQARRMSRLIDDLLSLSKIEERSHVRPRETVDAWEVVAHVVDGLAPLAAEFGVEVRLKKATPATTVRGDRDELTRVFENLIENAIKYGREGGRIDVRAHRDGASLFIDVRDHGAGIAPEHVPRLTERFYRIDVADSRAKGGTGLGLALAKNILLRHEGRLHVSSELGKGATFTAELPSL